MLNKEFYLLFFFFVITGGYGWILETHVGVEIYRRIGLWYLCLEWSWEKERVNRLSASRETCLSYPSSKGSCSTWILLVHGLLLRDTHFPTLLRHTCAQTWSNTCGLCKLDNCQQYENCFKAFRITFWKRTEKNNLCWLMHSLSHIVVWKAELSKTILYEGTLGDGDKWTTTEESELWKVILCYLRAAFQCWYSSLKA